MGRTLALLLCLFSSSVQAWGYNHHPYDKLSHAAGGIALRSLFDNPLQGIIASAAVGAAKEATDKNWDTKDMLAWLIGVKIEVKF